MHLFDAKFHENKIHTHTKNKNFLNKRKTIHGVVNMHRAISYKLALCKQQMTETGYSDRTASYSHYVTVVQIFKQNKYNTVSLTGLWLHFWCMHFNT